LNRKNRTGLWLSFTTLILTAMLIFTAYQHINFTPASAASVALQDPLNNERDCVVCHVPPWPSFDWYCHDALPTETYSSRMYLRLHLDWVISDLIIPTELYMPLATQLQQNAFEIHLFDRKLFPALSSITIGTTVTWTNMDIRDFTLQSQLASQQFPFETITLKPGESVSYTFEQAGVFPYTYQYADVRPAVVTPLSQSGYGKIVVSAPK